MNTLRETQNHSHSHHPHISWLREYSTTPASKSAGAFGINISIFLSLPCAVSAQSSYASLCACNRAQVENSVVLRALSHRSVNNHTTLRSSASSSIGIFVSVAFVRGVSCPGNQAPRVDRRRARTSEHLFLGERIEGRSEHMFRVFAPCPSVSESQNLVRSRAPFGRKTPRLTSHRSRGARSVMPIFSSMENEKRALASRTRSSARSSVKDGGRAVWRARPRSQKRAATSRAAGDRRAA
jgi:hypothetical protein